MYALTAAVLRHIRDNPGSSAGAVAEAFAMPLSPPTTTDDPGTLYMGEVLEALEKARLIHRDGHDAAATYLVADWWTGVQRTLGISLSNLAARQTSGALLVRPDFGPPKRPPDSSPSAFVSMPFSDALTQVYETVQRAVLGSDLVPVRGDDIRHPSDPEIMRAVWSALYACSVVIADCTRMNANVFYELGIAHTLGTPSILLTQDIADVPFNVRHRRVIIYESSEIGLCRLEMSIRKHLRAGPRDRSEA